MYFCITPRGLLGFNPTILFTKAMQIKLLIKYAVGLNNEALHIVVKKTRSMVI